MRCILNLLCLFVSTRTGFLINLYPVWSQCLIKRGSRYANLTSDQDLTLPRACNQIGNQGNSYCVWLKLDPAKHIYTKKMVWPCIACRTSCIHIFSKVFEPTNLLTVELIFFIHKIAIIDITPLRAHYYLQMTINRCDICS